MQFLLALWRAGNRWRHAIPLVTAAQTSLEAIFQFAHTVSCTVIWRRREYRTGQLAERPVISAGSDDSAAAMIGAHDVDEARYAGLRPQYGQERPPIYVDREWPSRFGSTHYLGQFVPQMCGGATRSATRKPGDELWFACNQQ